jgi:hypothetical protein
MTGRLRRRPGRCVDDRHPAPGTRHRALFVYCCRFHAYPDSPTSPWRQDPDGGIQDPDGSFGTPMPGVMTVLPGTEDSRFRARVRACP